jgi:hypothetical protein
MRSRDDDQMVYEKWLIYQDFGAPNSRREEAT